MANDKIPSVTNILLAAAYHGVSFCVTEAIMLQEAIASSAMEGAEIPDEAGIGRLAKAIRERHESEHAAK